LFILTLCLLLTLFFLARSPWEVTPRLITP